MYSSYQKYLSHQLEEIKEAGLYKNERVIVSPQGAEIELNTGQRVLNFCANNYLGLSANPELIAAAKNAPHGIHVPALKTNPLHQRRKVSMSVKYFRSILVVLVMGA